MRTTWILIANSSEARLFEASKSTKNMQLINTFAHPESRQKVIDLVTDLPGRYRNSGATPSSFYEDPANAKAVEAERFAHELAHKLNEGRTQNKYHHLILIAPPHFQGLLNKCCNIHVKNLITDTLEKDYTKLKQHELPHYLNGKFVLKKVA